MTGGPGPPKRYHPNIKPQEIQDGPLPDINGVITPINGLKNG